MEEMSPTKLGAKTKTLPCVVSRILRVLQKDKLVKLVSTGNAHNEKYYRITNLGKAILLDYRDILNKKIIIDQYKKEIEDIKKKYEV